MGSGAVLRFGTSLRRGMSILPYFLGRFAPYLERPLSSFIDAGGVSGSANDVVTDTRKVLHTTASDQNH